mgnify:CR=1 FL=1
MQIDAAYRVVSLSQRLLPLLGLSESELRGHCLWNLPIRWNPIDQGGVAHPTYLQELLRRFQEGFDGEILLDLHASKQHVRVALSAAPIYDGREHFEGWMLLLRREQPANNRRLELQQLKQQQAGIMEMSFLRLEDRQEATLYISHIVQKCLDAHRVTVWDMDETGSMLRCVARTGAKSTHIPESQPEWIRRDTCPHYFDMLQTHMTIDADEAQSDPRTAELSASYLHPHNIVSFLGLPVRGDRKLIGVLCIEQIEEIRSWNYTEKQFAATAASYLALAAEYEQKQKAQSEAQERARDLSVTLESISDAVIVTDHRRCIRNLNPAAEALLGYPLEEAQGLPAASVLRLTDTHTEEEVRLPLYDALDRLETISPDASFLLINRKEEVFYVTANANPICQPDGTIYGGVMVCRDITQAHIMSSRLRESEEQYRSIFEMAPLGIVHFDGAGAITQINRRMEENLSVRREKLLGFNLLHQLQDNQLLEALQEAFQNGKGYYEGAYQSIFSGKVIPSRTWIQTRTDTAGTVCGGIMIVEDNSQRQLMEHRLRESEAHYRSLVDSIPGAVFLSAFDDHLSSIYVSRYIENITGYSKNDFFQGRVHLMDLMHSNDQWEARLKLKKAYEKGANFRLLARLQHKDRRIIWVEILGAISARDESNPMVEGVIFDVSYRKETEKRLRESERMLSSINRNINEGIYRSTPKRGLIYVNQAFLQLFGYESLDELRQYTTYQLYAHPETRDRIADTLIECGDLVNQEVLFVRKDGSRFWGALNSTMNVESDGRVYFDGAIRDITLTKNALREIEHARRSAVEMNRLKSTFLANMSHELRTPLNGIIGLSDLQRKEEGLEERYRTYGAMIYKSGQRLLGAVNDIMDFSKMESGKLTVQLQPVDLVKVLRETTSLIQVVAEEKGLKLEMRAPERLQVRGDAWRLHQIFNNLIGNAIKFTEQGGIQVDMEADHRRVITRVIDTGPGIEPEFQKVIFNPFEQTSKGYQRTHEGTGLGLAITKELVEMHHGQIDLYSEPGAGTTFVVMLPMETDPS